MSALDFIDDLPDNPWFALESVCKKFDILRRKANDGTEIQFLGHYLEYVDFLALVLALSAKHNLTISVKPPELMSDRSSYMDSIEKYFVQLSTWTTVGGTSRHLQDATARFASRQELDFTMNLPKTTLAKYKISLTN